MISKRNVLLAAVLAAFSTAFVAHAADEKPADATSDMKGEPEKKKVKPHSHAQEKTGTPSAAPDTTTAPDATTVAKKKKPLHDHGKMHKGQ